ncbi:AdoMet-dependent rRNA methyltransferase spb1 [Sorochytrium milnesiophthora]
MGKKTKTGKGRLDKYYHLAKEQGYRSRASFKLIQLNKKHNFLEKAKVLIDLCAAPGGWLQVASKYMPAKSLIVGVDLVPIKPIPRCSTFAEDITTDKCRAILRGELKTWKADVVLHDGAPNVGTAWAQDAFTQAELVLSSLKLAVEFLIEGGTFVTKVFRSKDYNSLIWVFNQLFKHVEATKPPSSRNVSAEIFVVCRHYLAPKKVDPKFLDPRYVFKELEETVQTSMTSVFQPEKHRRHREGYNDGETILHHTVSAYDFVHTADPVGALASNNVITFSSDNDRSIQQHDSTTTEIRACCEDLKVLGKKEFRLLLRWRTAVREYLGLEKKESGDDAKPADGDAAAAEPELNDEEKMLAELEKLSKEQAARLKRQRRKVREKRAREMIRTQLSMTAPTDIGLEQQGGQDSLFNANGVSRDISKSGLQKLDVRKGDMSIVVDGVDVFDVEDGHIHGGADPLVPHPVGMDGYDSMMESSSGDDELGESDDDDDDVADQQMPDAPKLSGKAALFFDNPLFHGVLNASDNEEDEDDDDYGTSTTATMAIERSNKRKRGEPTLSDNDDDEDKPAKQVQVAEDGHDGAGADPNALVPEDYDSDVRSFVEESSESESEDETLGATYADVEVDVTGAPSNGLVTPEALTLAHKMVKSKAAVIDDSFNRYAFNDSHMLPGWFQEEEDRHNRPSLPVTKDAITAIRERLKALDAQPIKKIAEAKYRKKKKAMAVAERLMKQATSIAETEDMTEAAKAKSITKLMSKKLLKPKKKDKPKLVVAKNSNRGIKGRPTGVKGRYKMVDSRMKKEVRAQKRIAKKQAPKRRK